MAGLFTIGATPRFTPLGANDKSARSLPVDPSERPSHLPKFYFFAAQGTMKDQIISGAAAKNLYGSETFDEHGKFFKHTTKFLIGCTGAGQQVMAQRLLPSDIGPRSNLSLYIDLLEAEIPNYKRTSTGDIVKDVSGAPVVDDKKPNVKGYYVKFVTDYNSAEEPTQAGLLTSKPGVMMQEVTTMIDDPNGETEEVDVHTGKYRLVKVGTGKFDTVYDENPNPTKEELVAAEYKPKIKAKLEAAEADNNGDIEFKEVTIKWDKIVSIQDLEDKAGAADEATKETYGDIYIDTRSRRCLHSSYCRGW